MKIAVCDDNTEYINTIEDYIDELKLSDIEYDVFMSGEGILNQYERGYADYDAVFLDMEMGKLDGIETANRIRKYDKHIIIVFVTSHKRYMQRSFECTPFRFLLKPVNIQNFKKTLDEIRIKISDYTETFIFLENKKRTRIYCSEVVFFESVSHWILIHTYEGKIHKMRKSMTELLKTVDNNTFVRVHRAFMVNLMHIHQIGETEIVMHNYDQTIPLSKTYKKELNDKFLNFKERKYLL